MKDQHDLVYYLAYGSNLHPERLQARCPTAKWLETVYLTGYQLEFHTRGSDGSGKGNLIKTNQLEHAAIAAVFSMHRSEQPILDEIEGPPYKIEYLELELNHGKQECFIYLANEDHIEEDAQPYQWYKDLIYHGARFNKAHPEILQHIDSFTAKADMNEERNQHNQQLLEKIFAGL